MATYYFIRHGESAMNTTAHLVGGRSNETPLSERGVLQVKSLGRKFSELALDFDSVYASPAVRAYETAKHISYASGKSNRIILAEDLYELSQGASEGLPRSEVYTPTVLEDIAKLGKNFALPGGESMNDVAERMYRWLAKTDHEHGYDDNVLVVTHGIAIKCLIAQLEDHSQDWIYSTPISNASVTKIVSKNGNFTVQYIAKEMI